MRKREKSTTPGALCETRAAWKVCFGIRNEAAIEKAGATCSVNGAADLNGTWGVRSSAAQTLGKHPSFAFPLFQPHSRTLLHTPAAVEVIRFLVTINMRGRFQKSLLYFIMHSRFMECFYWAEWVVMQGACTDAGKFKDRTSGETLQICPTDLIHGAAGDLLVMRAGPTLGTKFPDVRRRLLLSCSLRDLGCGPYGNCTVAWRWYAVRFEDIYKLSLQAYGTSCYIFYTYMPLVLYRF